MAYAKKRLAAAQKAQVGQNSELKAELMQRRIKRLDVEIRRAQLSLDVESGKLADVNEVAERFTRRMAGFATRIKTWRESTIAKRPELRREVEEVCRQLQQLLADADE